MLKRAHRSSRGGRASNARTLPAPVGGWNAIDSFDNMPAQDAVNLVNWFPRQTGVVSRPGYSLYATLPTAADVGTLSEYNYGSTSEFFVASNGNIYDISTSTPSSVVTGLSTSQIYFSTASLNGTMFWCNGADSVRTYNGSSWATSTFTGATLADLNFVHVHESRVYFIEKQSQSFWYGGVGAVGSSALTEFDLSTTGNFSGELMFITSISRDGGAGPDDYLVFGFSGGDLAIYTGNNPGDSANFGRVGVFHIGEPISSESVLEFDSEVFIVTKRGYEPLSAVLQHGEATAERHLLSAKIQPEVLNTIRTAVSNNGWQAALYERGQMLIVHIPISSTLREQHVMNINTGAWCKFDIQAERWGEFGTKIYFGDTSGKIYLFDDGVYNDNGSVIKADAQSAWTYLNDPRYLKKVNMVQPVFNASSLPPIKLQVGTDFEEISLGGNLTNNISTDAPIWDSATWDSSTWGGQRRAHLPIIRRNGLGYSLSCRISLEVSVDEVRWSSLKYIFEPGGLL